MHRVFDLDTFAHGVLGRELEDAVRARTGARFAIGTDSGTDALALALRAVGIGPGDEVIVPAFAGFASASAVCQAGATPVFADIEPGSFTLDPDAVRDLLASRGHTGIRAILAVHLFAQTADLTALRAIADETGVTLVEDSSDAIGMRHGGIHAGLLGTVGVLSFSPTKTLGGLGDAGMIITDDAGTAQQCTALRHHGRTNEMIGVKSATSAAAVISGTNSKMDEVQAALLLARLPHLDEAIERRAELADRYTLSLGGIPAIVLPGIVPRKEPTEPVWHSYVIDVDRRDALRHHLTQSGVQTRVPSPLPLHRQPCFRHLPDAGRGHPVAEAAAARTLAMPLHQDLSAGDLDYVCAVTTDFYERGGS